MENRNQLDEFLVKYLLQELNTQEKEFVEEWIKADPQNSQYFEELSKTWKITALKQTKEIVDVNHEWKYFQQKIDLNNLQPVSNHQHKKLEQEGFKVTPGWKTVIRKVFISVAVAASILVLIGLGWMIFIEKKQDLQNVANGNKGAFKDTSRTFLRSEINNSEKSKTLILKDGSVIILAPRSNIRFQDPFTGGNREIFLNGQADFNIAKDRFKPFIVVSGNVSTTALGTHFTVTAYNNASRITIRLYEGKVVVKSLPNATKILLKDFYLLPGQELVLDNLKATAKVRMFIDEKEIDNNNSSEHLPSNDNPSLPNVNKSSSWFMFNNQSLAQVFEQLKEMYNVEIVYSKKDVGKMYFIGEFDKTDSVENILKQIAAPNSLKLTRENNRYIISK